MKIESQVVDVLLDDIIPNRFQPRLSFDEQAMEELTASIKEHGIIQPLVLRRVQNKYEIIAGERRFKAAKRAGLTSVPAVITNLDDNTSAEVALVENIQRKELSAIEEAKSYKILLDRGYLTQDELAKKMGVSQSNIANKIRLLNLDEEVQKALLEGKISERHARSLLQLSNRSDQKEFLQKIITNRLTVRQLDIELKERLSQNMDDTPIIEAVPTIDEIKNTATDLNPTKIGPSIETMLEPDKELVAPIPEVKPVEPEIQPKKEPANKFFNFLEDEEANMNIAEPEVPSASNVTLEPTPAVEIDPPSAPQKEQVEILDFSSPASSEVSESVINEQPIEVKPSIFPDQPVIAEPVISEQEIIDPVSKIDTLDPNYVPPVENMASSYELNDAINEIRDIAKSIENKGLVLDVEELDLENLYQITIKINKD